MFSRRRFLSVLALAVFSLLTACGKQAPQAPVAAKTIEDRFAFELGGQVVQLQVAVLPAETQRGLMYRRSMGENEGMLFIFAEPQQMSFWMRNTLIPLDVGYLDPAGVLREVYPMYPRDETPVLSRGRMQFVIEMNQGWYRTHAVKPGAQLDLAAVAAAVRARGLKPAAFGLR